MTTTQERGQWGGQRAGSGAIRLTLLDHVRRGTFNHRSTTHRDLLEQDRVLFGLFHDPSDERQGKLVDDLIGAQVDFQNRGCAKSGSAYERKRAIGFARQFEELCKQMPKGATFPLSTDEREWVATAEYAGAEEVYEPGELAYDDAPLVRATEELLQREGRLGHYDLYELVFDYLEGKQKLPPDVRRRALKLDAQQRVSGYSGP